jgi:hypothetical protein
MYYYGFKDQDVYTYQTPLDFYDFLGEEPEEDQEIIELKTGDKNNRNCTVDPELFLDSFTCGKFNCPDYAPRNGINGICINNYAGLIETGRAWIVKDGKLKKIRSRNKCSFTK